MIMRTVRRQLQKEQMDLAEQQRQDMLNRAQANNKPIQYLDEGYLRRTTMDPTDLAFQKIVIPRVTTVLTTEGIRAIINVKMNSLRTSGWTDYSNINVTLARGIEKDIRNASAVLRGILYHEGGHIKRTIPLPVLMRMYNDMIAGTGRAKLTRTDCEKYHGAWNLAEDQCMEMKVVDDSPNKAMYFLPMVLDVVLGQFKAVKALQDKAAAGETVSQADIDAAQQVGISAYEYTAWRRYLPKALRREMRQRYVAKRGEAATRTMEKALTAYMRAKDPIEAIDAIVAFHNSLHDKGMKVDNHDEMAGWWMSLPEGVLPENIAPAIDDDEDLNDDMGGFAADDDDDDDDDDEDFQALPEGSEEAGEAPENQDWVPPSEYDNTFQDDEDEADDEADALGDKADAPEADTPVTPDDDDEDFTPPTPNDEDVERDSTNVPADDDEMTEELERMLNEAIEERNADPILNSIDLEFHGAITDGVIGSMLPPLVSTAETSLLITGTAMSLAERLEEAFHAVTVEQSPSWREQQTRGVLNVGRYLTRQPGDREFFRDYDGGEGEKPGYNLAVSVLLDYSGSMSGSEGELAATAYAMKKACDNLDIPCTVVLWDHDARLLWDGLDKAEYVPVFKAEGGTSPIIALNDICNHRYERETHIVLFMTDGEFNTEDGYLNRWRTEGAYFIGTYYKHGKAPTTKELADLSKKGFDITHGVTELGDLVDLMEQALCDSVKP